MFSLLLLTTIVTPHDETAPSCCGKQFVITGEIQHYKNPTKVQVEGEKESDFSEEVFGRDFTATIKDLKSGTYHLKISTIETYFQSAGARVMDVECEGVAAKQFDIFKQAGFAKPAFIKLVVNHAGGPLKIHFKAITNNAKFNAIHVTDDKGTAIGCVAAADLVDLEAAKANVPPVVSGPVLYTNPKLSPEARAKDLVRRMSLAEKVGQMTNTTKPIPRLNIPAYDWWNEALHGVARNGIATVFPQAIGMAATWDTTLVHSVFDTVATEARAKYREAAEKDQRNIYQGLTFWTPNINIFRDPRWGRGHETYGEDPFLTSEMGIAVVTGLQGNDVQHPKVVATPKHFAVHSGPEPLRHVFDVSPTEDDLYDTYLPHFERVVRQSKPWSIMGAYNSVFGEPACSSTFLLNDLLRKSWGFKGCVVSDCGAITDIWANHKRVATKAEAAARAVKAGCDLECGGDYPALVQAINQHLISEKEVDRAVTRLMEARFRVGLLDPIGSGPYGSITKADYDTPQNDQLALKASRESMTLLKNDGVLPLDKSKLKTIAIIGPNADSTSVLVGNYNGDPSHPVTILAGIKEKLGGQVEVLYAKGCDYASKKGVGEISQDAVELAKKADVVLFVGGLTGDLEGEEGAGDGFDGFPGGDRAKIELPAVQLKMLKALEDTGKPVVVVNCTGSAVAFPGVNPNAILQAWYPGQRGGTAVADVLFGDVNPSGKLPVTFYGSTADLPDFTDYSMKNRTYRFFEGKPAWPFGHGLSYTKFTYGQAKLLNEGEAFSISLDVKNTGSRDGAEVVQVYARPVTRGAAKPIQMLVKFSRVELASGASKSVTLQIPPQSLALWDSKSKKRVVKPGEYELLIGSSSADVRQKITIGVK